MAMFEIEANGETYEIEAPDEASALRAFNTATNRKAPASNPGQMKPGSREYADWAAAQARAGKKLPQVSPPPPEQQALSGPMGKFDAGYTSFVNGIPIAGPTLLSGVENLRAMVQGMPVEQVQAEGKAAREANPITSGVGSVAGTVAPFIPLAASSLGGTLLGATGSLPAQIGFGAASGAAIGGLDTLARGGNTQDVIMSTMLGGGAGGAFPLVAKGVGAAFGALTGKGASKEAKQLAEVLRADGIKPADIPNLLKSTGPDAMVMDLGPNLQQQAGGLASTPGQAQTTLREAVANRAKGDSARVAKDVAETIGVSGDIDQITADIVASQKAAADPIYEAVRPVPLKPTTNLQFVFRTPMGREALKKAIQIAQNDGFDPSTGLTVGIVDYMKQALDDIARAGKRAGENNRARQATKLADLLKREADAQVPQYAKAREAFAGPAQLIDAIETGKTLLGKEVSPMQLKGMLDNLTPGERDGLLQGFQSSIEAQMGLAVNDVAALRNMFRKGYNEQKLRILLGEDVADDLLKRIDRQLKFGQTSNVVSSNSETARRLAAQKRLNPDMQDVGSVSWTGLVLQAINKARQGLRNKMQPGTNARQASFLASGGGNIDPNMIAQLTRASRTPRPLPVVPAVPGMLLNQERKPLEITVGGRR